MANHCPDCGGSEFEIVEGSNICNECGASQLNFVDIVVDDSTFIQDKPQFLIHSSTSKGKTCTQNVKGLYGEFLFKNIIKVYLFTKKIMNQVVNTDHIWFGVIADSHKFLDTFSHLLIIFQCLKLYNMHI